MTTDAMNQLKIYADAYNQIYALLNERERRLFPAETALRFGYGAISILSQRTGIAIPTIRRGIARLSSKEALDDGRVRGGDAGRRPVGGELPGHP